MSNLNLRTFRPSTSTISSCIYVALAIVVTVTLLKLVNTILYKQCHDALRSYETLSRFDVSDNDVVTKVLNVAYESSLLDPRHSRLTSIWNGCSLRGEDKSARERAWLSMVQSAFLETGRSTHATNNVSKLFDQQRRIRDSTRGPTKDIALFKRLSDLTIGLFDR